jgi:chromate transporter
MPQTIKPLDAIRLWSSECRATDRQAIGTILGACIPLGRIAIGDWLTALIGVLSLAVLFRWKVSNPLLIAATAAVGLIAFPLLQPQWVMLK